MDIIAKAKPIRFRIVSGGVECTSLDDLKAHFDLKSVADTINDGRLGKWLNYIKEFEFAEKIKEIGKFNPSDKKKLLKILSLFTGKKYNREYFKSDIEFIKFLDNDKNTSEFAISLLKESINRRRDVEVLLYAYHNHVELIPDVHAYFEPFLKPSNREVMWIYGKILFDSKENRDKEKGLGFIKDAANRGHKEAKEFIQNRRQEGRQEIRAAVQTSRPVSPTQLNGIANREHKDAKEFMHRSGQERLQGISDMAKPSTQTAPTQRTLSPQNVGGRKKEDITDVQLRKKIAQEIKKIIGSQWNMIPSGATLRFMYLSHSKNYPQEAKDIFKLFSKLCELTQCVEMEDVRRNLQKNTENYGTAQKIFDFVHLYVREYNISFLDVVREYRALNYPPADNRADEFEKGFRGYQLGLDVYSMGKTTVIPMPENPKYREFKRFLYYFMKNIMYL